MKKAISLVIFIIVTSACREEKPIEWKYLAGSDTIFIMDLIMQKDNYILPHLLSKHTDSAYYSTAKLRLDFYFDRKKTVSKTITTDYYSDNGYITAGFGLDRIEHDSNFFKVFIGGNIADKERECLLFYKYSDSIQLVDRWEFRSGLNEASGTELFMNDHVDSIKSFWSRHFVETPQEKIYSDSISFKKVGNKWEMTRLTPKGKVIRTKSTKQNQQ